MKDFQQTYVKAQNALNENKLKSALKFGTICKKARPDDPKVWLLLGAINGRTGNYPAAEQCYSKALELNSGICEAWYFLAMTKIFQGQMGEATHRCLNEALAINENFVPALVGRACLQRDCGSLTEAVTTFKTALTIDPNNTDALLNLGNTLKLTGEYQQSLEYLDRILLLQPQHYSALASKALVLYYMGNFADSNAVITQAVQSGAIDPLIAQAYAEITKNTESIEAALVYIEKVLKSGNFAAIQTDELHYSAAKLYDKNNQYDKAFAHIVLANKNKSSLFDVSYYATYLKNMRSVFSHEFIDKHKLCTKNNITPVFIVGMPRSGSSLIEQILSCHPNVHAGGELTAMLDILKSISGIDAKSISLPERFTELETVQLADIAQHYYSELCRDASDQMYITDKLPTNFERIGMIRILFPCAKILHARRNPLDTCISCYFQNFGNNHAYVNDLAKLGQVYNLYREIMQHWNTLPDIDLHDVDYEQLVLEPETTIAAMLEYCGLPWFDACLEFYKSDRLTKTASFDQVRQPLYHSSINRWQHYEKYIKTLTDQLGV